MVFGCLEETCQFNMHLCLAQYVPTNLSLLNKTHWHANNPALVFFCFKHKLFSCSPHSHYANFELRNYTILIQLAISSHKSVSHFGHCRAGTQTATNPFGINDASRPKPTYHNPNPPFPLCHF